jgi:hypothetical protein
LHDLEASYHFMQASNLGSLMPQSGAAGDGSIERSPPLDFRNAGVRFFQETEAQAIDFADGHLTVFCGKKFPALRTLTEGDIKRAWSGVIYYILDDYPFVERRHNGRMITFAAPSDHGNAPAIRVGADDRRCGGRRARSGQRRSSSTSPAWNAAAAPV